MKTTAISGLLLLTGLAFLPALAACGGGETACVTPRDCEETQTCVNGFCVARGADGSVRDGSLRDDGGRVDDVGPRPDGEVLVDAGDDARPPTCDAPCDTGNPCESGVFDCSGGTPVCEAVGAGNAGSVCRAAADACDVQELCDGSSTECPADSKLAAGTVCREGVGECDIAEECDGATNACPLDGFADVGTTCAGGFCDESHACSDSCTPGAACTPSDICRTGQIECSMGTPRCVAMGNVSDGTECQATEYGGWAACGSFSNTCDETGSQARSATTYACQSGACRTTAGSETRPCTRTTDGGSCGTVTTGTWSACGGFVGTCGISGTRTRSVMTPTCSGGSCSTANTTETGSCSRTTDGTSCGTVTYGAWGACGGFASTCATTGTRSRSVMTPTCGAGSCAMVTSSENEACTRSTAGNSCGSTTYSAWSVCGGFTFVCDETGTETRTQMVPVCAAGACVNQNTTESRDCTRDTDGLACPRGSCCFRGMCENICP